MKNWIIYALLLIGLLIALSVDVNNNNLKGERYNMSNVRIEWEER